MSGPGPGPVLVLQPVKVRPGHAPAIVLQLDMEHPALQGHTDLQAALPLFAPEAVPDAVLHKGLQEELMYLQ